MNTTLRKKFYYLRNILTYVVPKKKNYWVFRVRFGDTKFVGNIRALMCYLREHHPAIQMTLISFEDTVIEEAKSLGFHTEKGYFKMNMALLKAEYIFIDSNDIDFENGKFSFIQLWHGAGFKDVGLLNDRPSDKRKRILKRNYNKYKLVVTTSESDKQKQNKSFDTDVSVITGYPRNDVFFAPEAYFEKIKKKYKLEQYSKIICYAPTFRDDPTIKAFTCEFWDELNDYLVATNSLFVVKKHYRDQFLKIPHHFDHIVDLTFQVDDVQELLLISDVLISDYSSIATDFVLTGKPILIYAYDLEVYSANCRSIYYDINKVLPQPFLKTEDELLAALKDENWTNDEAYQKSYQHFQSLFHQYLDGNSSKRVVEEIFKLRNS